GAAARRGGLLTRRPAREPGGHGAREAPPLHGGGGDGRRGARHGARRARRAARRAGSRPRRDDRAHPTDRPAGARRAQARPEPAAPGDRLPDVHGLARLRRGARGLRRLRREAPAGVDAAEGVEPLDVTNVRSLHLPPCPALPSSGGPVTALPPPLPARSSSTPPSACSPRAAWTAWRCATWHARWRS